MKKKNLLMTAIAIIGLATITRAQVPSYVPTNGLVGWWPFNGNANDESGNGNNGTVNGATLTTDRFGNTNQAYSFDGVSSVIQLTNANIPIYNSARTVSVWFKFNLPITNQIPSLIRLGDNNYVIPGERFGLQYYNNELMVEFVNSSVGTPFSPDNEWHLFSVSYPENGTGSNSIKLYVDGILRSNYSFINPIGILNTSGNPNYGIAYTIGALNNEFLQLVPNYYWNGKIDDIGIWNRALTSAEITALYTGVPTDNNETSNTTTNVPDAISYQAVARNSQGAPLADTNVQVQFILLADSLTGAAEYSETHTLTTNSLGLFTTAFGAGSPINGSFNGIDWSAGNKYVNVQINTGSGWVDMGTQQLLSTPYSMHSATSGAIKNPGLPVYADNAAAIAAGLVAGDMYRTSAGILMVVY